MQAERQIAEKRKNFTRERNTDRADRWKILYWEQRRANAGSGAARSSGVADGDGLLTRAFPAEAYHSRFRPPNLRMSIEALLGAQRSDNSRCCAVRVLRSFFFFHLLGARQPYWKTEQAK